mgnify:CR=1 FL=1
MQDVCMKILCDIGGTYARFAHCGPNDQGAAQNIIRYKRSDFENFMAALNTYCKDIGHEAGGILIAGVAGYHGGDPLEIFTSQDWFNPTSLTNNGWDLNALYNDFEAGALALPHFNEDERSLIKSGNGPTLSESLCLIGPGTGLGLAYLRDQKPQMSVGGHFPASATNIEQRHVIERLQNTGIANVSYEDLVSGRGLMNIYEALGGHGLKLEEFLDHASDTFVKQALHLFHEFFGQFAATCVIAGHSYGGLYLTGGVLERLIEAKLFDKKLFLHAYENASALPAVKDALNGVSIYHVRYSYPAIKGLTYAK